MNYYLYVRLQLLINDDVLRKRLMMLINSIQNFKFNCVLVLFRFYLISCYICYLNQPFIGTESPLEDIWIKFSIFYHTRSIVIRLCSFVPWIVAIFCCVQGGSKKCPIGQGGISSQRRRFLNENVRFYRGEIY